MANTSGTILGVSYGHGDSSAALILDNQLVAACEEERFTRIKHDTSFPRHAIKYCLSHAGLEPRDIKVVAIAKNPFRTLPRKLWLALKYPKAAQRRGKKKKGLSLEQELNAVGVRPLKVVRVEHHLAHLVSARCLTTDENPALFSFDGLGDFVSAAYGNVANGKTQILDRVYFPHSLGFYYTAMTQYLGFPYFGDEFKVMGLSAYGEPNYLKEVRGLVQTDDRFGFRLNFEAFPIQQSISCFYIENSQPYVRTLFNSNFLTQLLGIPPRKPHQPITKQHWDLAKSVQTRFEEVASHCLNQVHKAVPSETICLAGGCAHNSVWVGKIAEQTPFKKVFVAPASHDAGIAVGAAVYACGEKTLSPEGDHWALLGPNHTESTVSAHRVRSEVSERAFKGEQELCDWVVDKLIDGHIIGLFHGRLEFGPRALGSRSIIADPRIPDIKERLNSRVKHRESFRPFAASVLWEHQEDWFNNSFYAPTMEAVFKVSEKHSKEIPGVVHADQSCRIQSVKRENQPFYWQLLETFRKRTGVPMLINTSFNDCEPVVCSQDDALKCFSNTDIDHLVLGDLAISRLKSEPPANR